MGIVNVGSLAATLDAVDEAFFFGHRLTKKDRTEAANWISSRQGLPGSYRGMFAPTASDFAGGITLFTGEKMRTRAGTAHVLGEQACRALILLGVREGAAAAALRRASGAMAAALGPARGWKGRYCCFKCTVALWRHLAVGGLDAPEKRLAIGMRYLKSLRTGDGRWHGFPFYYTVLSLTEMAMPSAQAEMRYAAPACERLIDRLRGRDRVSRRRLAVVQRVLERVS